MSLYNTVLDNSCNSEGYKEYKLESFNETDLKKTQDKALGFEEYFSKNECKEKIFLGYPSDGRGKAEIIIEKANEEAENILKNTKNKVYEIEQEAYKKGYIQGEKDGKELGIKKIEKVVENIQKIFIEISKYPIEFQKKYENEMINLICKIAEKIVKSRTDIDTHIVKESIIGALNIATEKTRIKIRVNPYEIEYIKDLRTKYFETIPELKIISIESDASIEKGGCILETSFGHIDARVDTQLEQIGKSVKEEFKKTVMRNN